MNSVRRINPLHRCLPRTRVSFPVWTCWCDSDSPVGASYGCRSGSPKCLSRVRISYRPYLPAAASHLVWSYSECCPWGSLRKKEITSICLIICKTSILQPLVCNFDHNILFHSIAQWIKHQNITCIPQSPVIYRYNQTDQSTGKIWRLFWFFKIQSNEHGGELLYSSFRFSI